MQAPWVRVLGPAVLFGSAVFTLWARLVLGTMWSPDAILNKAMSCGPTVLRHHPASHLHRNASDAPPLSTQVQFTMGGRACRWQSVAPHPAIAAAGHDKTAALCGGSRLTRRAPSLCCPDRPHRAEIATDQSQAGCPTRHGCLMHQGLVQEVVLNPGSPTRRKRQPKLKINVQVWNTEDR